MKLGLLLKEKKDSGFPPPPIPLEEPDKKKTTKDSVLELKLRSNPTDEKSGYILKVPYFKEGTPEEWLAFKTKLRDVFVGQQLTTGPMQYQMARRLLKGEPLQKFNRKAENLGNKTVLNFNACLRAVCESVFLNLVLKHQKRYMCRVLRKSKEMSMKAYYARFQELNRYLEKFPPFGVRKKLPNDEVLEHKEFVIPNSWQKQMILQGFNAVEKTNDKFIEFCKRIETAESIQSFVLKKSQKGKSENGNSEDPGSQVSTGRTKKGRKCKANSLYYCLYHGENTTHNTDQCRVMK